jgi:hypothetical protein
MISQVTSSHRVRLVATERSSDIEISCNYSILKTLMAITQIVYGSIEVYHAREHQFDRLGYGAYALTVVPYILMSL